MVVSSIKYVCSRIKSSSTVQLFHGGIGVTPQFDHRSYIVRIDDNLSIIYSYKEGYHVDSNRYIKEIKYDKK